MAMAKTQLRIWTVERFGASKGDMGYEHRLHRSFQKVQGQCAGAGNFFLLLTTAPAADFGQYDHCVD